MEYVRSIFDDKMISYPQEGDVISVDGYDYVAREASPSDIPLPCAKCVFNDKDANQICLSVACREYERPDGKWMVFTLAD
ncbi:MAG: hypothetical protein M0P29_12875 [Sphaerochaetaceae bacterium]|jgi:hypothetical protein|nr:hypothetical protein [Sphaerochaetaceae bacterium]